MNLIFKDPKILERMHEGPLGPYVDSYADDMHQQGYAAHTAESQIRRVADFSRWLAKHRLPPQEITTELLQRYLRFRARHRRPKSDDLAALKRLLNLLLKQGVIPAPPRPSVTPADQLRNEFGSYLRQERALAASTVCHYLSIVGEFLAGLFGAGPVDLSTLCSSDIIKFVQRRAVSIKSKRVQLLTTALRSFLRFARYRGDLRTDLAACVPAVANWSLSTVPRALPPGQTELTLASCNRKTPVGRRDYAILSVHGERPERTMHAVGQDDGRRAESMVGRAAQTKHRALWLGHESVETTQIYLDANLALKEEILAKTTPPHGKPGRYKADDELLAFLNHL